jgi:hypothetical protein
MRRLLALVFLALLTLPLARPPSALEVAGSAVTS